MEIIIRGSFAPDERMMDEIIAAIRNAVEERDVLILSPKQNKEPPPDADQG